MKELIRALLDRPSAKSAKPSPELLRSCASRVKLPLYVKRPRDSGGWRMLKLTIGFHSTPSFMVWPPLIRLTFSMKW